MKLTARAAGADEDLTKTVEEISRRHLVEIWDLKLSPPEISAPLYHAAGRICGTSDPFLARKVRYTHEALKFLPVIEPITRDADDPFEMAVRISIAGNIIDFGTGENRDCLDVAGIVDRFIEKPIRVGDLKALHQTALSARNILFIGDNAGETVFDRPFLSILREMGDIYYATRDVPVINDVTVKDAVLAGIGSYAKIISSGSSLPGTVLGKCSAEFRKIYEDADLIIAKGQGNFETMTELPRDGRLFMLFIIKCNVAARQIGGEVGDMVVMRW